MKKKVFNPASKNIVLDEPAEELVSTLKARRTAAGLSTQALAELLNVSASSIVLYEKKKNMPQIHCLIKLAEIFSFDLSDSINYKLFHGIVNKETLRRTFRMYGFNYSEMARLTGYSSRSIQECFAFSDKATPQCIAAIFSVLERERKLYTSKPAYARQGRKRKPKPKFKFTPEKLQELRKKKGITAKQLSRLAGLGSTVISHYECGEYQPTDEIWERLIKILCSKTITPPPEVNVKTVDFSFEVGHCYSISDIYTGLKHSNDMNPAYGVQCVFRYEGMDGIHHRFTEIDGGWARTFTNSQLIGKKIKEVQQ